MYVLCIHIIINTSHIVCVYMYVCMYICSILFFVFFIFRPCTYSFTHSLAHTLGDSYILPIYLWNFPSARDTVNDFYTFSRFLHFVRKLVGRRPYRARDTAESVALDFSYFTWCTKKLKQTKQKILLLGPSSCKLFKWPWTSYIMICL